MKMKLTFLSLLFSVTLVAQVQNQPVSLNAYDDYAFNIMPQSLSYDGSNRVYIRTADDEVAVYSNDFKPVRTIAVTPIDRFEISVRKSRLVQKNLVRENVVEEDSKYSSSEWIYNYITGEYSETVPSFWTKDSIKTYLENERGLRNVTTVSHPNGGTRFIYDMYEYEYYKFTTFGTKYPTHAFYWTIDGYLLEEYIAYIDKSEYTKTYGDWSVVSSSDTAKWSQDWGIGYMNYDNEQILPLGGFIDSEMGDGLCFTQTLFNNDEKYEYLNFSYEIVEEEDYYGGYPGTEEDYNNESSYYYEDKTFYYAANYTGFNVMTEDGSTLQTVSFPQGFKMIGYVEAVVIRFANEYYIICVGEDENDDDIEILLIYKINKNGSTTTIEQVGEPIKVAAYPNPANRNQMITIELKGENVDNAHTDLQVINMQGQVIKQQRIQPGQKQAQINTGNFSSGLHLIKAIQNGKNVGTEKVIVK